MISRLLSRKVLGWAAVAVTLGFGMLGWRNHKYSEARQEHFRVGRDYAATDIRLLMEFPERLRESSGVAMSESNTGLFWTHNDSGDGPVIYGVRPGEGIVVELELVGAPSRDWEDIDLGTCPFPSEGLCLFVGDIGDNLGRRSSVSILIVEEPLIEAADRGLISVPWKRVIAKYEGGSRDAEALAVDETGRVFVISKGRDGFHRVSGASAEDLLAGTEGSPVVLASLGELPLVPEWWLGKQITGGTESGGRLVLRTYTEVYVFGLESGSWVQIGGPCFLGALGGGGEGLDVGPTGLFYLTRESGGDRRPAALHEADCSDMEQAVVEAR